MFMLFTYRRRVRTPDGEEGLADYFINPLTVASFHWEIHKTSRTLNVFLVNNYTTVFGEQTGLRFVQHMENFLSNMAKAEIPRPKGRKRYPIDVIDDEEQDEEPETADGEWS